MKLIINVTLFLSILLVLTSCIEGNRKQTVEVNTPKEIINEKTVTLDQFDEEFIDGMTEALWHYYLEMQMALVHKDASKTGAVAEYLSESFGQKHLDLKFLARKISETDYIETQRALFSDLSKGLEPIFKAAISVGAIYKIHCPSALNNTGAFWLSNVPQVKNPYMERKEVPCGSVVEIIKNENPKTLAL